MSIGLSWSFNLRGRLPVWHIQEPTEINSGQGGWLLPCLHSSSPSLQLLVFPGNNLAHSSGPLIFTTDAQGILLDCLALMVSSIFTYSHTRLFIFAINKPSSESMTSYTTTFSDKKPNFTLQITRNSKLVGERK